MSGPASARRSPRLSVVVACRDEAAVLPAFHATLLADLRGVGPRWEIVYVDDGSRDGTLYRLRAFAAADRRVACLSLGRRRGKDAAMAAGLARTAGDCVVFVDADLQHPTALLAPMVEQHTRGYEQVVARRRPSRSGGAGRRLGSRVFHLLARVLCDVELVEGTGDFRLISRRVATVALARPGQHGYMRGLFSSLPFPSAYVDYDWRPRAAGRSAWSTVALVRYGVRALIACRRRSSQPPRTPGGVERACGTAAITTGAVSASAARVVGRPGLRTPSTAGSDPSRSGP
ncbi:glycosyltransferase family 2 protein [Streptomyces sp. LaPpAH-108]|uniref:glycosyltransferase family 2 protein n=1 Tax=Streptomyces sp. LaPpAH-108 TaxID=1155714 RepID=UPI001319BEAA|nr:glycosyltransferase family 2 protein [Streptomyces sp. LaPpAH-108]